MVLYLDNALIRRKKLSLAREEPQVIFAILAKEHFAGVCAILVASGVNCDLGGQWVIWTAVKND